MLKRQTMKKPELLAPAGDLERLKMALHYGADAVYVGGEAFGLRSKAKNFGLDDLRAGVEFAHQKGKKVFLTMNIIPHNQDLERLPSYLEDIADIPLDALIVSDPGTLMMIKEWRPDTEIHLSTQANNTNAASARFWHQQGVSRIVLARELSLDEIKEIRRETPEELTLEAFIHGAMCMSYSGRCLLSNYLTGRDANRGNCAQPCRWSYDLVERSRPDETFHIEETDKGSFIFNSKDLCMVRHIPEMIKAGVDSLKIEGRMKSIYYVASVVRVYREVLDRWFENPDEYVYQPAWFDELTKISHREYTTGFYFGKPDQTAQLYSSSSYIRNYQFVGIVESYDPQTKRARVKQKNHFTVGQQVEIIGPSYRYHKMTIEKMFDDEGASITTAPHAEMMVELPMPFEVFEGDLLRVEKENA